MKETKETKYIRVWLKTPVGFRFSGTDLGTDSVGFINILDRKTQKILRFNPSEIRMVEEITSEVQE